MVLNELEKGLRHHSLITSDEMRKRFGEIIGMVKREYEEIVKNEVQRAISADEDAISKLAANYIDNIKAFTLKERVKNRYTGQDEDPDERLMRSIEEKIEIPENRKDDFRREIMNFIGALAVEGKKFEWNTNDRLRRALELKLFEDQKDSIKLKTLVSAVVDKDTQEKIDIIKSRLIKNFGYNEVERDRRAQLRRVDLRARRRQRMSTFKKTLMKQGMKLMSDPRVMKLMQDERVMKAVMAAMSVPGQGADLRPRAGRDHREGDGARHRGRGEGPAPHGAQARGRGRALEERSRRATSPSEARAAESLRPRASRIQRADERPRHQRRVAADEQVDVPERQRRGRSCRARGCA